MLQLGRYVNSDKERAVNDHLGPEYEDPSESGQETRPETQQRRRMVLWGAISALFLALTIVVLLFGGIFSSTSDKSNEQSSDEQTRNSAIGVLLDQLDQQTNGAIGVDGTSETWTWKSDMNVVTFKLHVGNCHGVDGYAATPARPDNTGQVTVHVLIPEQNDNAAPADLTLRNDADLASLKRTLPKSGLQQCVAGDARLAPTGG